ncbi:MAG: hypothetical protein JKY52_09160 [Flavobacteriales bacterium]|nr:hypothetical protein [Flavobacteriales bacterium]
MELLDKLKDLKTDKQKWQFIIDVKPLLEVVLDNDETWVQVKGDDDCGWVAFDKSVGSMPGIVPLLEAIGISVDYV